MDSEVKELLTTVKKNFCITLFFRLGWSVTSPLWYSHLSKTHVKLSFLSSFPNTGVTGGNKQLSLCCRWRINKIFLVARNIACRNVTCSDPSLRHESATARSLGLQVRITWSSNYSEEALTHWGLRRGWGGTSIVLQCDWNGGFVM
jgi:hypothetical protein